MGFDIFEVKVCSLKTVSPVHIGSVEQKLTSFEYLEKDGIVYHLSEDKLAQVLAGLNLVEPYVREVEIRGSNLRIMDFFRRHGVRINEKNLIELISGRCSRILGDASAMRDFRPFIRDGMGRIYIPGTSIKGVIRTAILYCALRDLKEKDAAKFVEHVESRIERDMMQRRDKKKMSEWLNKEWFESFILQPTDHAQDSNQGMGPHTDWLRMLHITDAYPDSAFEPIIIPVNVVKKERNGLQPKREKTGEPTTIWVECVPEGVSFGFQIRWDRGLLNDFKKFNDHITLPKNLHEIAENITKWANDIIEAEKSFFSGQRKMKFYDLKESKPNFRIGFGSGMMATTIFPLLSEDLRKKIRNYAGLNRGNEEAPKSRRLWTKEDSFIPLGWANFETLPCEKGKPIFFEKKEESENEIEVSARAKKSPEPITWPGAYITYSPGNKTLIATYENKRAEKRIGDDKSFVPEKFHKILFEKRKGVRANITVEPLGNAFEIIKIEENQKTEG